MGAATNTCLCLRVMRGVVLVVSVLVLCSFHQPNPKPPAYTRFEFGFSLNPTAQGEMYALFMYTVLDNKVVDSRPMRVGTYILQMAGLEESRANIEGLDLFEEYGIAGCAAYSEEGQLHTGLDCSSIRDLWKLRYRGAAVEGRGTGWAGEEYRPSDRQQILLQAYRGDDYPHWHGPYFGKDALRLLRDMQDPDWVRMYRDGG